MLGVEAILLLLPALVSLIYGEFSGVYFLIPSGILIVIYLLVGMKKPEKRTIYGKEGMVITATAARMIPKYARSSSFFHTGLKSLISRKKYRLKLTPNKIIKIEITPSI